MGGGGERFVEKVKKEIVLFILGAIFLGWWLLGLVVYPRLETLLELIRSYIVKGIHIGSVVIEIHRHADIMLLLCMDTSRRIRKNNVRSKNF